MSPGFQSHPRNHKFASVYLPDVNQFIRSCPPCLRREQCAQPRNTFALYLRCCKPWLREPRLERQEGLLREPAFPRVTACRGQRARLGHAASCPPLPTGSPRFRLPAEAAWGKIESKALKIRITKASEKQDKALKSMSTVPYTLSTLWTLAVLSFSMRGAFFISRSGGFTSSCMLSGMQATKLSSNVQKCGHFACCLFRLEPSTSSYHVFTDEILKNEIGNYLNVYKDMQT